MSYSYQIVAFDSSIYYSRLPFQGNDGIAECRWNGSVCYVIDNNGYVVISQNLNDTGRFFGKVKGAVMQAMVEESIFHKIVLYDWQALCSTKTEVSSEASLLLTPYRLMRLGAQFLVTELIWMASRINLYVMGRGGGNEETVYDEHDYDSAVTMQPPSKKLRKGQNQEEEDYFNRILTPVYETDYFACDKQYDLYMLNQSLFIQGNGFSSKLKTSCST